MLKKLFALVAIATPIAAQSPQAAIVTNIVCSTPVDSSKVAPANLQLMHEHPEIRRCETAALLAVYHSGNSAMPRCTVKIGSDQDCVISAYGKPDVINRTTVASGVSEQWVYGDGERYVYFTNGQVTAIQDRRR